MLRCPKCRKSYEEGYTFCEECGVKLISSRPQIANSKKEMVFDQAEKYILFRITRYFTWFILIAAILGFIGAIFYLIPDLRPFILKDTSVSWKEVKKVLESKRYLKSPSEGEAPIKNIDPELLAKLDKEIYELILLLPKKIQGEAEMERARGWIKDRLGHYSTIKEKLGVLKEAKKVLIKFNEPERDGAMVTYFDIKSNKERSNVLGETEAKIKLATIGGIFFALIMTIAAFSLILVLLAIERNTRKE